MKLGGNDNKINPQLGAVIIGSALTLFAVLAIAIIPAVKKKNHHINFSEVTNEKTQNSENTLAQNSDGSGTGSSTGAGGDQSLIIDDPVADSGITSPDELDFWDLYPIEGTEQGVEEIIDSGVKNDGVSSDITGGDANGNKDENPDENDPSKDGKHTKVVLRDGSEEWVTISQYLPKSELDFSNLVCKDDRMEYYIDGKKTSYLGIDISKYQDYIDFNKVKKDGIDFVMIRVGARGYGTGQITIDDYFFDNLKRATDAGLKVGVYFTSQAINTDEAIEEAQTVIDSIGEYKIDYPVALDMGFVDNDTARIEALSPNERTEIAKTFLDLISGSGFTGCIYGTKEWLIKEIEMSKLTAYDFWLTQEEDLPDYPYKFSMWQYKTKGSVDGVSGFVDLNISFVDYTEK